MLFESNYGSWSNYSIVNCLVRKNNDIYHQTISMKRIIVFIALGLSATLLACNQASKNPVSGTDTVSSLVPATQVVLKDDHLNAAYKDYQSLKDALVASNVGQSQQAASVLSESLNNIEGCRNTADIAAKIARSSVLDEQRKNFTLLSADFIPLMQHADLEAGTMYIQYCPMANSGKGGYWISSSDSIRNPYYGVKMLKCGEVKQTINPLRSNGENP
jgi:hypothetical protein